MAIKTEEVAVAALEAAPIGIMITDEQQQIVFCNPQARQLLAAAGWSDKQRGMDSLPAALRSKLNEPDSIAEVATKDDTTRTFKLSRHRTQHGTFHFIADLSELHEAQKQCEQLSDELGRLTTRDGLTSLPNQKALWQALEPLISRSRRYENPLSVVRLGVSVRAPKDAAADADAHDAAMVAVAQLLRDQVRWADLVGRFDDREFLLILPETPGDAATALVDKLRAKLAELEVPSGAGEKLPLSAQFGLASWQKGDDGRLLLKRAGERMARQSEGAAAA
jgi:diguanylate cyclase (GGDEF)-like protein